MKLQSQLTLNQISPVSFSPPTDVTLKLSDGSIDAHKMILAAVSPVFERMFYGDFKEGNAKEVELPKDNYITMKLLINFVYSGSCDTDDLDSVLPLIAAFDFYQINKAPLQHMCDEAILSQMDSSSYLTLLPKYVSVMSEEGHKKAADKVMSYTNNDFVTKFDQTKDLPEEVMLPLLKCSSIPCHEIEIFEFLVKWHTYQTKDLGNILQLTTQLFRSIRYELIVPQLLSSKVANCELADKDLVNKAFHYIHSSCNPIGEYSIDECQGFFSPCLRKPTRSSCVEWSTYSSYATILDDRTVQYSGNFGQDYILKSAPLLNGIYLISISNIRCSYCNPEIAITVIGKQKCYLHKESLTSGSLITMSIHDDHMFLKGINANKVKSTVCISGSKPFRVCICSTSSCKERHYFSI